MGTVRFQIPPPETQLSVGGPSISPDGKQIIFLGLHETGKKSLWVHEIGSSVDRKLADIDELRPHFWSPDSRFIGFFSNRKLKKIDLLGGAAVSLADVFRGFGGTWNRQGTILFVSDVRGPIYRVSAAGGEATAITTLDPSQQEMSHRFPYFLPDGRHFLYRVRAKLEKDTGLYVGSLDSNERKFLVNANGAAYSPPGYLLFERDETLMAQRFDVIQLEVSGEPFPIAENVEARSYSVSENGVLVYQSASTANSRLVWRDRSGKLLGTVGEPADYFSVALSPDQKRVAVTRLDGSSGADIWLLELSTGIPSRLTFDPSTDVAPIWSPEGRHLAFASLRNGSASLFQKTLGGGVRSKYCSNPRISIGPRFGPRTETSSLSLSRRNR